MARDHIRDDLVGTPLKKEQNRRFDRSFRAAEKSVEGRRQGLLTVVVPAFRACEKIDVVQAFRPAVSGQT